MPKSKLQSAIGNQKSAMSLAPGEGVEPSSSGSKPDVLPVAPSRKNIADCRLLIADLKI
jgi:hypothetical protein